MSEIEKALWNKDLDKNIILEQYKLYVEMADRISARREGVNKFFLTLHTSIWGLIGFLWSNNLKVTEKSHILLFGFCLIIASYYWFRLIKSYRQLNTAKFKIIGLIEKELPCNLYGKAEWETALKEGKDSKLYEPLTHIEELIPFGLIFIYIIVFGLYLYSLS